MNIKTLPNDLKWWYKEIFGNLNEQIKIKRKKLENLHNQNMNQKNPWRNK